MKSVLRIRDTGWEKSGFRIGKIQIRDDKHPGSATLNFTRESGSVFKVQIRIQQLSEYGCNTDPDPKPW